MHELLWTMPVAGVLLGLVTMAWLRGTWLFPVGRRYKHRDFAGIHQNNVVCEAREEVAIFNGALTHRFFDHPTTLAQFRDAVDRGVRLRVLFGPACDVETVGFLSLAARHPQQVELFAVPREREHELFDRSLDLWRYTHFAVADGRHACVESRHGLSIPVDGARWEEFLDLPEIASPLRRRFQEFAGRLGVRLDPVVLAKDPRRSGLRFVRFVPPVEGAKGAPEVGPQAPGRGSPSSTPASLVPRDAADEDLETLSRAVRGVA